MVEQEQTIQRQTQKEDVSEQPWKMIEIAFIVTETPSPL